MCSVASYLLSGPAMRNMIFSWIKKREAHGDCRGFSFYASQNKTQNEKLLVLSVKVQSCTDERLLEAVEITQFPSRFSCHCNFHPNVKYARNPPACMHSDTCTHYDWTQKVVKLNSHLVAQCRENVCHLLIQWNILDVSYKKFSKFFSFFLFLYKMLLIDCFGFFFQTWRSQHNQTSAMLNLLTRSANRNLKNEITAIDSVVVVLGSDVLDGCRLAPVAVGVDVGAVADVIVNFASLDDVGAIGRRQCVQQNCVVTLRPGERAIPDAVGQCHPAVAIAPGNGARQRSLLRRIGWLFDYRYRCLWLNSHSTRRILLLLFAC